MNNLGPKVLKESTFSDPSGSYILLRETIN